MDEDGEEGTAGTGGKVASPGACSASKGGDSIPKLDHAFTAVAVENDEAEEQRQDAFFFFKMSVLKHIQSEFAEKTVAESTEMARHMWARLSQEKQEFWQQKASKALLAEGSEKA